MLKPEKMMENTLMATSIYFAHAIKTRLVANGENTWTLVMLMSVLACWLKVDHFYAQWLKAAAEKKTISTPDKVVEECVFVISQTLNFLVVNFFITTIDGLISEQHLYFENAVLPALMLLFCVFLVTVTKKFQEGEKEDETH